MNLHGFELVRDQAIPELSTEARLYRHIKTGAELLSLENDDENKCFGITFATPPVGLDRRGAYPGTCRAVRLAQVPAQRPVRGAD